MSGRGTRDGGVALAPVVLASASAARAALLDRAGVAFTVAPADIDEPAVRAALKKEGAAPEAIALVLAEQKAREVSARHAGALVIGADQLLVLEGRIFAKPADAAAARRQLVALRGRTHTLLSAFACLRDGEMVARGCPSARLTMRAFSDAFLDAYLDRVGAAVLASVGAYRLEGAGIQLFERIEGDYFTILGLPLIELLAALRGAGAVPA